MQKGSKKTRNAFVMSLLSILVCVAMLVGSTFAWFTDSASSGNNKIVAGNLDIDVLHTNASVTTTETIEGDTELFCDASGNAITWEPGVISYENFTVKNLGTLALKYKLAMNITDYNALDDYTLKEALKVKVLKGDQRLTTITRESVQALDWSDASTLDSFKDEDKLLVDGEKELQVIVYWIPTDNDNLRNANNGKQTSDGEPLFIDFGIEVVASQLNQESDSFDQNYDRDIILPELPISINKQFQSSPITTASVTESVTIENKSTSESVASMPAAAVNPVIQDLLKLATDKKADSDISTTIYLDVTTESKTGTSVKYDVSLSAKMTYTDQSDAKKKVELASLDGKMGDQIVTASMYIGKGLNNVAVSHSGTPMTALTSASSDAEGFYYDSATGTLTIKSKSFSPFEVTFTAAAAYIGDKAYETVCEALENTVAGCTVVVLKDETFPYPRSEGHQFNMADNVTVNLNKHKISCTNYGCIFAGNNLTIKNGTFEAIGEKPYYSLFFGDRKNGTAIEGVTVDNVTCLGGINIYKVTGITIKNTVVSDSSVPNDFNAVYAKDSTVTVEGGSYQSTANDSGVLFNVDDLTIKGGYFVAPTYGLTYYPATMKIYGGTFTVDPSASVVEGYDVIKDDATNTWTVEKHYPVKVTLGSTGATKGFETLEEAFTYNVANQGTAEARNTIKMYDDIDYHEKYTVSFKLMVDLTNTVFDLNQKTFTVFGNSSICYYGDNFKICNGTANDSRTIDTNNVGYAIRVGNYGAGPASPTDLYAASNVEIDGITMRGGINLCNTRTASISNVTSTAMSTSRYCVYAQDCENVVIKSGTYTMKNPNNYGTISDWYSYSITLEGGTFVKAGPRTRDPYKGEYPTIVHYDSTTETFTDGSDLSKYVDDSKYDVTIKTENGNRTTIVSKKQ